MIFVICLVLVGLGFLAWKHPSKVPTIYFQKSLKTLLISLGGLGSAECLKIAIIPNDMDMIGFVLVALAIAWVALILSILNFFKIYTEH